MVDRSQRAHLFARHGIFELEAQGDTMLIARYDALHRLVKVPAPDLACLRRKMQLAYAEVLEVNDEHGLILALLADLERLSSSS